MPRTTKSGRTVGTLTVTFAILLAAHCLVGNTPESQLLAQEGAGQTYRGTRNCDRCHQSKLSRSDAILGDFFLANEAEVVYDHDKHAKAYDLIRADKNPLAKAMEDKLREYKGDANYKVTNDAGCLACHGDMYNKPNLGQLKTFGVTCESCHGPASKWEGQHYDASWRAIPGKDKAALGFFDVRNPISRAKICFSCHIGSPQEGKVVTHEMYAVGHPPLPGIEVETFISEMPTHWRSINEKADFVNRDKWIAGNLGVKAEDVSGDLVKTKAVLISGVMSLRQSVNLFVSQAILQEKSWPEFAAFDCLACHHDLDSPSWRQRRGYAKAVPGRPLPFAWPTALVKLAIRIRAGDDAQYNNDVADFEKHLAEVYQAATRKPFGDPEDFKNLGLDFGAKYAVVAPKAEPKDLVQWLDKLADDIFHRKLDARAAKEVLADVVALPNKDYPDFHSARQLVWAYRTISVEIQSGHPAFTPPTEERTLEELEQNHEKLHAWKQSTAGIQSKVDEQLKALGYYDKLHLDLPGGQEETVWESLPTALDIIGKYDQDWFREQLPKLQQVIAN